MDIKNISSIVFAWILTLILVICAFKVKSVEESSGPVLVFEPEIMSQAEAKQLNEQIKQSVKKPIVNPATESITEPVIETALEDDRIFYDVPFDVETQEEIIKICSEYDISYELILGVIFVESSYRPDVLGDGGKSFGLMQIQPRWWSKTMEREGVTDLLDPIQNIRCGCAILRELKDRYDTDYRALQAYNTGKPDTNNGYADKVYKYVGELTERTQND